MRLKRIFFGEVEGTGEQIEIHDYRRKSQRRPGSGADMYDGRPNCITSDGRKVRVLGGDYLSVDYEKLKGEWEIEIQRNWLPVRVFGENIAAPIE